METDNTYSDLATHTQDINDITEDLHDQGENFDEVVEANVTVQIEFFGEDV